MTQSVKSMIKYLDKKMSLKNNVVNGVASPRINYIKNDLICFRHSLKHGTRHVRMKEEVGFGSHEGHSW